MKTKSRYSFENRGTDRQTESITECTLEDISNDTRLPKLKISLRRGKQYTPPPLVTRYTKGEA